MDAVLVPVVIALVAALVVILLAARLSASAQGSHFFADLRAGLRRGGSRGGVLSSARRDLADAAEADSEGVDLLFARAATSQGYLTTDELAERLGLSTLAPRR